MALQTAVPGISETMANRLYAMGKRLTRNRHTLSTISRVRAYRRGSLDDELSEYLGASGRLIEALALASGARTIVDTSKSGAAIILMSMLDRSQLDVVHLVRDLRGVAWSQVSQSHLNVAPDIRPPRRALATSAIEWLYINVGIAYAKRYCHRYTRISYETVFASPRDQFHSLCDYLDLDDRALLWSDDSRAVTLLPQHVISGNPNRFGSRQRTLKVDDSWRQMAALKRLALGPVAKSVALLFRPIRRPK
jgi:hypothetical protein